MAFKSVKPLKIIAVKPIKAPKLNSQKLTTAKPTVKQVKPKSAAF